MKYIYIVAVQPYRQSLQILSVYSELGKAYDALNEVEKFFFKVYGDFVFIIIKAPIDHALDIDHIRDYGDNISPFMEIIVEDYKEDVQELAGWRNDLNLYKEENK